MEGVDDAKSQTIAGNWGCGSTLASRAVDTRDSGKQDQSNRQGIL